MEYVFALVFTIMSQDGHEPACGNGPFITYSIFSNLKSCQKVADSKTTKEEVRGSVFITKWTCEKIKVEK